MAKGNRNQVLNCRVTESTLSIIDNLRYVSLKWSRADVIEYVFNVLSEDIDGTELKELLYNRSRNFSFLSAWKLSLNKR